MGIPESQLDTWSHQGSISQSSDTYASIKRALEAEDAGYARRRFDVFLQGSYGNDTNIYSESDVDVVIRFTSSFWHDLSELPSEQQQAFNKCHHDGDYKFTTFKSDVESALRRPFGDSVKPGERAFKVKENETRRNADVVTAFAYRRYYRFNGLNDQRFDEGIKFITTKGQEIINYPKQHSENLTKKNKETDGMFKPMARILKNARSHLVGVSAIGEKTAPSYFLEGLLYNVPNEQIIGRSYKDALAASINWIYEADRSTFLCANEQYYLLRNSNVTWAPEQCDQFLNAFATLWRSW